MFVWDEIRLVEDRKQADRKLVLTGAAAEIHHGRDVVRRHATRRQVIEKLRQRHRNGDAQNGRHQRFAPANNRPMRAAVSVFAKIAGESSTVILKLPFPLRFFAYPQDLWISLCMSLGIEGRNAHDYTHPLGVAKV